MSLGLSNVIVEQNFINVGLNTPPMPLSFHCVLVCVCVCAMSLIFSLQPGVVPCGATVTVYMKLNCLFFVKFVEFVVSVSTHTQTMFSSPTRKQSN